MNFLKQLTCGVLVSLAISAFADDLSYKLAPGVIHANINSMGMYRISALNDSSSPILLAVTPIYYPVGGGKSGPYQNEKPISNAEQFDLTPYIQLSPKNLHLAPGQGRSVRILARVPASLTPGTYRANIEFAMQLSPQDQAILNAPQSSDAGGAKKLSTQVIVLINQVATIYADVGKGNAQAAKVSCHIAGNNEIQLDIYNNTNWLFNPSVEVVNSNAAVSSTENVDKYPLNIVPVMPQSEAQRLVSIPANTIAPYSIRWRLNDIANASWTTVNCSK